MDTYKVLSAFYISDRDALLVSVEGRDARFRPGAHIRDAFGRKYEIGSLVAIGNLPSSQAQRITSFLIPGRTEIGRLIRFDQ